MEAAASFREVGFEVGQSSSFHDPELGKSREIDVLAEDTDIFSVIEIYFSIECKSNKKPWVVLTARSREQIVGISSYCVTSEPVRRLSYERGFYDPEKFSPYLKRKTLFGYSLRQTFGDKNDLDPAYGAAMSAIKSCHNLQSSSARFMFAFPVIVVDTPLFECIRSSEDGQLKIRQVDASEFAFSAHLPTLVSSRIHVVTRGALPAFSAWARSLSTELRSSLQEDEKAFFNTPRGGT